MSLLARSNAFSLACLHFKLSLNEHIKNYLQSYKVPVVTQTDLDYFAIEGTAQDQFTMEFLSK